MEPVKIGIVGISGFAQQHLKAITFCEEAGLASLEAVTVRPGDRNVPEFSLVDERGLRLYADSEEMFTAEKGRLDLIALPVGIGFHAPLALAALKAGFHVMCEKPAAGTLDEALQMKKAWEESGRILAIGFQNIFTPSIQRIKQIRLDRILGELKEARTTVSWPRNSDYYGRNGWAGRLTDRGKRINDSPMQNANAHHLQNMLYVAGASRGESATPVALYGEQYRVQPIESADTQFVRLETAEGPVLQFSATHACRENRHPKTEFIFRRGRILWEEGRTRVFLSTKESEICVETFDNGETPIHNRVFWDVCVAIREGRQPLSTIGNAWQQVLCVEKLFESVPIVTVGDPHKEILREGKTENHLIPAISDLQEKMFRQGVGFAEAGAPWVKPGRTVAIELSGPNL